MKKNIKKVVSLIDYNLAPSGIILKSTRHISDEDAKVSPWNFVKKTYIDAAEKETNNVEKVAASIVNAIVHQQRIYFSLTDRGLRKIKDEDKNQKVGLDSKLHKNVYRFLHDKKIMKLFWKGTGHLATVYEVINPLILDLITADRPTQYKEAIKFTKYKITTEQVDNTLETETEKVPIAVNAALKEKLTFLKALDIFLNSKGKDDLVAELKKYEYSLETCSPHFPFVLIRDHFPNECDKTYLFEKLGMGICLAPLRKTSSFSKKIKVL